MMATAAAPSDPIEKKLDMSLDQIVQEHQQQAQQEQAQAPDGRARSTKRAERLAQKGPYAHRVALAVAKEGGMEVEMEMADEDGEGDADDEASAGRRVYVGNLSWGVKWRDLKDHMRAAGQVERAVVLESNGRSKGCGVVTYATQEEAQEAIEMLNDSELEGRKIFVREDREEKSGAAAHKGTRVFVGNLSYRVKWQDLKDHMKQAGNVVHADVLMEGPGRSRGCGMVEYSTEDEAKLAIATLHDTELEGRKIFVREDREPEGGSISRIANRAAGGRKGASPKKGASSGNQRAPRTPPSPPSPEPSAVANDGTSLYVGNIPWDTTWQDLKDVFRQVGDVEHAEVAQYSSGRSRGFGIVRFVNPQDALQAIERLNGTELNGRTIEVRYDKGK